MATVVGHLLAKLSVNSMAFARGMTQAGRSATTLGAKVQAVGAKINASLSAAFAPLLAIGSVAGFGALIRSNMKAIDATGKLAERLGATTEEILKLRHAAELTGAGAGTLDKGLAVMTKRIGEAATGTGLAKKYLDAMGLSIDELQRMSPGEAFMTIADAISQMETASQRNAAASNIFSRANQALVNTLSQGKAGLKAMGDELERLGGLYSREDAARVEAANDAWERMGQTWKGLSQSVTVSLAPAFTWLAETLHDITQYVKQAQAGLLLFISDLAGLVGKIPGIGKLSKVGQGLRGIQEEFRQRAMDIGATINFDLPKPIKQLDDSTQAATHSMGELRYKLKDVGDEMSRIKKINRDFEEWLAMPDMRAKLKATDRTMTPDWWNDLLGNTGRMGTDGAQLAGAVQRGTLAGASLEAQWTAGKGGQSAEETLLKMLDEQYEANRVRGEMRKSLEQIAEESKQTITVQI